MPQTIATTTIKFGEPLVDLQFTSVKEGNAVRLRWVKPLGVTSQKLRRKELNGQFEEMNVNMVAGGDLVDTYLDTGNSHAGPLTLGHTYVYELTVDHA